jgi:hypothetical protein
MSGNVTFFDKKVIICDKSFRYSGHILNLEIYMTRTIKVKETGEEIEGNNPFFQFYKHNFKTIRKLITENALAAKLFMFLVETMDNYNAIIVSQRALEEVLGVSGRTIRRATEYLVENKYIQILKSGTSNVYCVNADIVWTQRADKKMFAKFETKVYLTVSEQSEQVKAQVQSEYQKVALLKEKELGVLRTDNNEFF